MIAKDKLQHAAVGTAAAFFGLGVWALAATAGLVPMAGAPGAAALAALVAGISKEGADYLDNRVQPGMHEVSLWDAVATAAPGLVLGLIAQQVLMTVSPQ